MICRDLHGMFLLHVQLLSLLYLLHLVSMHKTATTHQRGHHMNHLHTVLHLIKKVKVRNHLHETVGNLSGQLQRVVPKKERKSHLSHLLSIHSLVPIAAGALVGMVLMSLFHHPSIRYHLGRSMYQLQLQLTLQRQKLQRKLQRREAQKQEEHQTDNSKEGDAVSSHFSFKDSDVDGDSRNYWNK